MKRSVLSAGAALAVFVTATSTLAQPAARPTTTDPAAGNTQTTAQSAAQIGQGSTGEGTSVAEVVVTGSLIRGASMQAALPVQVISQDDLVKQGLPTTVELVKSLPSTGGVIGDANGFAAGRTEGQANINLRDLGAARTLVLVNGRRMVNSSAGAFVDVNGIPPAAIGRVEVLKDGAAATYGSDAIGGVVNFITRKNLHGLELGAEYTQIDGSDGDTQARLAYGWGAGKLDVFLAASYLHRSQLGTTDRDFATPKFGDQASAKNAYLYNPQGGWSSAANPGTYIGGTAFNANFLDPGCPTLGGQLQISATQCLFRYADFYHLVEEQNLYQVYAEANYKVSDKLKFHVEGMFSDTEVFHIAQSTSYGPNQYPTTLTSTLNNQYFIPAGNPGLVTLLALNPTLAAGNPIARTTGVLAHPFFDRPIGVGGNALYGSNAQEDKRYAKQYRLSGDVSGRFDVLGGLNYDVALTYGHSEYDSTNPDFLVDRLELGYRGFASKANGPACDFRTGVAEQGNCFYFNPFSTGVAANAITGQANPQYAAAVALDPRVVNDKEVIRWIYGPDPQRTLTSNDLFVVDAVTSGKLPIHLWGDPISFALGYQYRDASVDFRGVGFTSNDAYPCIDSILQPTNTCTTRNGPYTFYGNYKSYSVSQQTNAEFGELDVPITKDLQTQLALRHESSQGGDTTNPKFAFRWQLNPVFALRGSVGTTFRAAPQVALIGNATTALAFVSQTSSYKPFDNYGNPGLQAEKANTYNIGGIVNYAGFSGTLDYFRFDFSNPITSESGLNIINTVFPTGQPNNCANPAFAQLLTRFTFSGACSAANIVRVRTSTINGTPWRTDGMDASGEYRWRDVFGGRLRVGADVTYTFNFNVGAQIVEGVRTNAAFNAVGKLNYLLQVSSLPRIKGSGFVEYTHDRHNVRMTVHYVGDLKDQRDNIFASTNNGQGQTNRGKVIGEFITTDVIYRLQLPWDADVTLGVVNLFDIDPPFARLDYSYDPFTANPLGRQVKFAFNKRF